MPPLFFTQSSLAQWLGMRAPWLWNDSWTAGLVNHLWQSTLMAGVALLLTLALKKNQARIRYWVWMLASIKFLLPFSLLMDAGSWLRTTISAPIARPAVSLAIEQVAAPLQNVQNAGAAGPAHAETLVWMPVILLAVWFSGVLLIAARWLRGWMRIRAAVRVATPTNIAADVQVLTTASLIEPGVFGILRPVLLLPNGIPERLEAQQLRAVVAHEMCHIRRRDNLTFAMHMISEAVFWFHPLTWWIGSRLIEERELACDEAVLDSGSEAEAYAEGILNVCKFYIQSPLSCAAGVSGADLKHRIARIMSAPARHKLNWRRKLLLGTAGIASLLLPLMLGLVRTALAEERAEDAAARLPKFEVASIKPHQVGQQMRIAMRMTPDGVDFAGLPLERLVQLSFGLSDNRILNEPAWVKSAEFDIATKVESDDAPKLKSLTMDERWAMMIPVLQDRFGLKFHRETRNLEVYTLTVSKSGLKMKQAQPAADAKAEPGPSQSRTMVQFSPNETMMRTGSAGTTTEMLARMIAMQVGTTVLDKTGLTGKYVCELHWASDRSMGPAMPPGANPPGTQAAEESNVPPLPTALEEQLGLKLVSQKEPVEVVVIDQIQQPSAN